MRRQDEIAPLLHLGPYMQHLDLIVVGVALDTVKQLEAQLMMRNYGAS